MSDKYLAFYTYGVEYYDDKNGAPPLSEIKKSMVYKFKNISPYMLCHAFYQMKGFTLSKLVSDKTEYDADNCAIFHQPQKFMHIWDIVNLSETEKIKECIFKGIYRNQKVTAIIDFNFHSVTLKTETGEFQKPLCDFIENVLDNILTGYKIGILSLVNMQEDTPLNIIEYKIFNDITVEDVKALCDQLSNSGFFTGTSQDKNQKVYLIDGLSQKGINTLALFQNK